MASGIHFFRPSLNRWVLSVCELCLWQCVQRLQVFWDSRQANELTLGVGVVGVTEVACLGFSVFSGQQSRFG
jgi:hypothetical protein